MRLTRDSIGWWLAIAGALLVYLTSADAPPTQWTYQDWIQFLSVCVATLSGKLATSPLPGASDPADPADPKE